MAEKEAWKQGLAAVREKAAANGNHITVGEILSCFSNMELDEEQIRLIYRYVEDEHIAVSYTHLDVYKRQGLNIALLHDAYTGA